MQLGMNCTTGALSVLLILAMASVARAQPDFWNGRDRFVPQTPAVEQSGRREWTWQGGNALSYGGPGRLRYEPGGSPRIIVTGDPAIVETIEVSGGEIRRRNTSGLPDSSERSPQVEILVRGVTLDRFKLSGSASTELGRLQRDRLDLQVDGSGSVSGQGQAKRLNVQVDGSGQANLRQLNAGEAHITITGSGTTDIGNVDRNVNVVLTGSGDANLGKVDTITAKLTGSGDVRLASQPRKGSYDIRGSGRVVMIGPDGKPSDLGRMKPAR
jgi:hypothetical protein